MNLHIPLICDSIDSTYPRLAIALNKVPKKPRFGRVRAFKDLANIGRCESALWEADGSESEVTGGIVRFPSVVDTCLMTRSASQMIGLVHVISFASITKSPVDITLH